MARPRIFVSSTYYDLKHLRSSLENFVQSLGFDAILSEKGRIAYTPDLPLDESCYREVGNSDIFVIIVGGRYGSEASAGKHVVPKTFYDRYNSITREEYQSAIKRDVPTYILIEKAVQAEYETYLRNRDNESIVYAHVDSVNVFEMIDYILSQPRNNPVQQFEKYSEIETWLKEQWAGLFQEMLERTQEKQQIASLQAQVGQLSELNTTLKRYLEEIVSKIAPDKSEHLIKTETQRLKDAAIDQIILSNPLGSYLVSDNNFPIEHVRSALLTAKSASEFFDQLLVPKVTREERNLLTHLKSISMRSIVREDLNLLRSMVAMPSWSENDTERAGPISLAASKGQRPKSPRPAAKKSQR